MLLDTNKARLKNCDQIKMAVSVFVDHGFSKQDIHSKIVSIFSVDPDQLDEVLNSSDNLDLYVSENSSVNARIEQLRLMVATKYWSGISTDKIQ